MNLPDSSKTSSRSKAKTARKPARLDLQKVTGPAADGDHELKLRSASALAASGYLCGINVNLSATAAKGLADVTDVDVLAIRFDVSFAPRVLVGSCKSGANLAVAKEVFYLRGVVEYLQADEGLVLMSGKEVPPHIRDLGRQLEIRVLAGADAERWRAGLLNGMEDAGYFSAAGYEALRETLSGVEPGELSEWLKVDFWFHRDFRNAARIIGYARKLTTRLDGSQPWHGVYVYYVAMNLCLTVMQLCRTVEMLGRDGVLETTRAFLLGGAHSYKARRDLFERVHRLLKDTGAVARGGPQLPPLDLPFSNALAELVVRFVERPHAAIRVPMILQDRMWRGLGAKGIAPGAAKNEIAGEKLAQDTLEFLKQSGALQWVPSVFQVADVDPGGGAVTGQEPQ